MALNDAADLINLIPRRGFCQMRGGYEEWSTGVGSGDVDMVADYWSGSTRQLLSASSTNIYNSTNNGAAVSLGSGFTNGRWDTATFGGVMAFVNGDDTPQQWDGTTLSTLTITGTSLTSSDLIGVNIFKSRSYFWEKDSLDFWYSSVNTLGGALTKFPLGDLASKGGKLLRMISWTRDGGSGPDDFAVFIMSSGEVFVYQGDDPGSSSAWSLVGSYDVGEPVNDRAITKFGAQVVLVNENDLIFIPDSFNQETPPPTKIQTAIADAVDSFGMNDGWETFVYPNERLMMINVPVQTGPDLFDQYVFDSSTFAPCRFTDIPARCWVMHDGNAFFGSTDGTVYRFNTVAADDSSNIDVTAITAWTDFGIPENKSIAALRPVLEVESELDLSTKVGWDFDEETTSSPTSSSSGGTPWGSSWGSPWGTATTIQKKWRLGSGRGSHANMTLRFSRQGDSPRWIRTDVIVKGGGDL